MEQHTQTSSSIPAKPKKGVFDRRLFLRSGIRGYLGATVLFGVLLITCAPNARQLETMDSMSVCV
jgi:hypothetical protein